MGNTKSKKKNTTSSSSDKKKNEEDKKPISPQIITLAKKTNFSTTDLQKLYDEFRVIAAQSNDDPNELTKEQFLDVLDKHEVMLETLGDIFLLSECDFLVTHQASALSRIVLSLTSVRLGYIPPYMSLDGPWCYHWRMCCDVRPNGEQITC